VCTKLLSVKKWERVGTVADPWNIFGWEGAASGSLLGNFSEGSTTSFVDKW
jgi:hypothetical protein